MSGRARRVVVGVDGSPQSVAALRWAAEEASVRRTELLVVTVLDGRLPRALRGCSRPSGAGAAELECIAMQRRLIASLPQSVGSTTRGRVLHGEPVGTLTRLVGTEDLLVVGTRSRGTVSTLARRSVARACSAHLASRVVVVPFAFRGLGRQAGSGPVVVGVDTSPAARRAVQFAAEEAELRGAPLLAVHVLFPGYVEASLRAGHRAAPDASLLEPLEGVAAQLDALLRAEVAGRHVRAVPVASTGEPAVDLLRWAESAELLVIGTRGTGRLGAVLLGSTTAQILRATACPTAVIGWDEG